MRLTTREGLCLWNGRTPSQQLVLLVCLPTDQTCPRDTAGLVVCGCWCRPPMVVFDASMPMLCLLLTACVHEQQSAQLLWCFEGKQHDEWSVRCVFVCHLCTTVQREWLCVSTGSNKCCTEGLRACTVWLLSVGFSQYRGFVVCVGWLLVGRGW